MAFLKWAAAVSGRAAFTASIPSHAAGNPRAARTSGWLIAPAKRRRSYLSRTTWSQNSPEGLFKTLLVRFKMISICEWAPEDENPKSVGSEGPSPACGSSQHRRWTGRTGRRSPGMKREQVALLRGIIFALGWCRLLIPVNGITVWHSQSYI